MKVTSMKWIGLLAVAAFPLYSGYSQSSPAPAAPATPPTAPAPNNPPAVLTITKPTGDMAEVLKLTKAGVGEDVVVAFVKNSHTYFNLSANDILHLKDEGVSALVLSAMLTHDTSLRNEGMNQPPAQFNYNQQSFPPGGQFPPGQTIAPPQQPDGSAGNAQIATPPLVPTAPPAGSQPPPDQTEVVPASPGADYYWAPGYWGWNGGWIWIGGGWYPHGYFGWGWHGGWRGGYRGGGWGGGSHGGSSHGGGGWGRSGH
jgi:hypothetical protein